jgi:hypothetical protein
MRFRLSLAILVAAAVGGIGAHAAAQSAPKALVDSARVDLRRYCRTNKPVGYLCPIDTLRLARASAALAPTPPPPPPPPVDTTYTSMMATDFESGTITPWYDPWAGQYQSSDLAVVNDPTNAGHGKVLSIHYYNDPATGWYDNNHGITLDTSSPAYQLGLVAEILFTGDFYLQKGPTDSLINARGLRKLNYWCAWAGTSGSDSHFCFVLATQPSVAPDVPTAPEQMFWTVPVTGPSNIGEQYGYTSVYVPTNQWHALKIQMRFNSARTKQDGILRVWLDGQVVVDRSNLWYVDPLATNDFGFGDWRIGYQLNSGQKVDETRYWDNIRILVKKNSALMASRTQRNVGPKSYPGREEIGPPNIAVHSATRIPVRIP